MVEAIAEYCSCYFVAKFEKLAVLQDFFFALSLAWEIQSHTVFFFF